MKFSEIGLMTRTLPCGVCDRDPKSRVKKNIFIRYIGMLLVVSFAPDLCLHECGLILGAMKMCAMNLNPLPSPI